MSGDDSYYIESQLAAAEERADRLGRQLAQAERQIDHLSSEVQELRAENAGLCRELMAYGGPGD